MKTHDTIIQVRVRTATIDGQTMPVVTKWIGECDSDMSPEHLEAAKRGATQAINNITHEGWMRYARNIETCLEATTVTHLPEELKEKE